MNKILIYINELILTNGTFIVEFTIVEVDIDWHCFFFIVIKHSSSVNVFSQNEFQFQISLLKKIPSHQQKKFFINILIKN
jgi:hypothetical protein